MVDCYERGIIIVRADLAPKISYFIQIVKLSSNSSPTSLWRPYSPTVKEDFSGKIWIFQK